MSKNSREEVQPLPLQDTIDAILAGMDQHEEDPVEVVHVYETVVESGPPPKHRRRYWIIALFCLPIIIAGTLAGAYASTLFPVASVTVTLVPITRTITTTSTATVPGRVLSAITMSQAGHTLATGTAHQDATPAHGTVTFFNAAPTVQTVAAGTLLTGASGIQVVTDQDATIPGGTLATNGQASVPAHTLITGNGANIAAGDIYGPCCRADVLVSNGPFSGGQAARDYQAVSQADIDGVAATLKTSLMQSMQAAAQTQVHADETLVLPIGCTSQVSSDHQAGDAATQVIVTVTDTCTPITYQTNALLHAALVANTQAAQKQLGKGYTLASGLQTSVTHASMQQGQVSVTVASSGIWMYSFTSAMLHQLATKIAGMSREQATMYLLHQAGIAQVSVNRTLPTNPDSIRVSVVYLA